jgi:hypothetical protein
MRSFIAIVLLLSVPALGGRRRATRSGVSFEIGRGRRDAAR